MCNSTKADRGSPKTYDKDLGIGVFGSLGLWVFEFQKTAQSTLASSSARDRLQGGLLLAGALAATDVSHQWRQSLQVFPGPLAHQADLDPISPQEIAAVVTEQITGAAELAAQAAG